MKRSVLITSMALWALGAIQALAAPIPIGGRIVDPRGRPVRGASVELVPVVSRYEAGELQLQGKASAEPDPRGGSGRSS